jgi:hypothetical protein
MSLESGVALPANGVRVRPGGSALGDDPAGGLGVVLSSQG